MILQNIVSWFVPRPPYAGHDPRRALIYRGIVLEILVGIAVYVAIEPRYRQSAFYYDDCPSTWWPITAEVLLPALLISSVINALVLRPTIRHPDRGFWRQFFPAAFWSLIGGSLTGLVWIGIYDILSSQVCTFKGNYGADFFLPTSISLCMGLGFWALLSAHSGRTRMQHTFRYARQMMILLSPFTVLLIWFGYGLGQGLNLGITTPPTLLKIAFDVVVGLGVIYILMVIAMGSVWLADYWGQVKTDA